MDLHGGGTLPDRSDTCSYESAIVCDDLVKRVDRSSSLGDRLLGEDLWVLSPHPDDAMLSCGGLLARRRDEGTAPATIITVFDGDPPESRSSALARFAEPALRRAEDVEAARAAGCARHSLGWADAIDRRSADGRRLYPKPASIFGPIAREDRGLVEALAAELALLLEPTATLLCPMSAGGHIDHRVAAGAGFHMLAAGGSVAFYEDAPYIYVDAGPRLPRETPSSALERLGARTQASAEIELDADAKSALVAHYHSQIGPLFGSLEGYREELVGGPCRVGGALVERFHLLASV
jgi:LmbE family N-acetylglucosaminyl deacetylase